MLSNPADVKLRHLIHLRQLHNSENMHSTACTEKMNFSCIPFVYEKKFLSQDYSIEKARSSQIIFLMY